MTDTDRGGIQALTGALLIFLIVWIPVSYSRYDQGVKEVFVLLSIWMGLLFSATMSSRRTTGHQVTLFPVFQAFMIVSGYSLVQELGFALAAFLGSLAYGLRTGSDSRKNLTDSSWFMLGSLFSLRAASFLFQPLRESAISGYPQATAALLAASACAVLLNNLARIASQTGNPASVTRGFLPILKSMGYPMIVAVLMVPAVLDNGTATGPEWPWAVPACTVAVIALQSGISILLDRARFTHTRSLFLENEIGRHTRILSGMETPMEALRTLTSFWFTSASPLAVKVTWRNISIICPTTGEPPAEKPLRISGEAGLVMDIWPTQMTPLDPERLEIFITQTETVLTNLELRERVSREGWECLEAMVHSLDVTDRRRTGYSNRVAEISRRVGRRMGLSEAALDDLEMAAMLHLTSILLERAEEDWQTTFSSNQSRGHFELPPEVVNGIRHLTENYDGTGRPEGLREDGIPLLSRILSVACTFAAGRESGTGEASLQEIRNRSGSIYDPAVVAVLDGLLMDDSEVPATSLRGMSGVQPAGG